jgi:AraC family transcriptional regulator, melibiose operon regulatory protein
MQIKDFKIDHQNRELTQHKTKLLPLACYKTTIHHNVHGYIPLHWHEEVQFVYILKGTVRFQVNEQEILVKEGEGLFINSECLHGAKDEPNSNASYICLNVLPSFLMMPDLISAYVTPYIQATNLDHIRIEQTIAWGKEACEHILSIYELLTKEDEFYEIHISKQLTSLWLLLISNATPVTDPASLRKNKRIKDMLAWIHLHYDEAVSLENIAKAGLLSKSECCRYFKSILGLSPMQYVNYYRIEKSLSLLQHTDLSVTEVAYKVGFNGSSYYIEQFKKSMHTTPKSYQKSVKNEETEGL